MQHYVGVASASGKPTSCVTEQLTKSAPEYNVCQPMPQSARVREDNRGHRDCVQLLYAAHSGFKVISTATRIQPHCKSTAFLSIERVCLSRRAFQGRPSTRSGSRRVTQLSQCLCTRSGEYVSRASPQNAGPLLRACVPEPAAAAEGRSAILITFSSRGVSAASFIQLSREDSDRHHVASAGFKRLICLR